MDRRRRAAWEAALANKDRGEEVSEEEHYKLLRDGLFDGLNLVDEREEAKFVVRYCTHGLDTSEIEWRGVREGEDWFSLMGEPCWEDGSEVEQAIIEVRRERQAQKLRAMIDRSKDDHDYWIAVNDIAARLHEAREQFPEILADWAAKLHRGELDEPPKRQSNEGQPHYAQDARNSAYGYAFSLLGHLGLTSRMKRYEAIARAFNVSIRTVSDAIKAVEQSDGRLALPWECWPR